MKEQLPWWIGGPVLGLCVVAIRGLLNARLGVTGAFSEVIDRVGERSLAFDWRGWFAIGILVFRLARTWRAPAGVAPAVAVGLSLGGPVTRDCAPLWRWLARSSSG